MGVVIDLLETIAETFGGVLGEAAKRLFANRRIAFVITFRPIVVAAAIK